MSDNQNPAIVYLHETLQRRHAEFADRFPALADTDHFYIPYGEEWESNAQFTYDGSQDDYGDMHEERSA